MKHIHLDNNHRKKHFEFFKKMNHPHFNICANVNISAVLPFLKKNALPFTPTLVFLVAKTANLIPEFRQRIREDGIVEHELVHPSFTVLTEVADVFSFCEVPFQKDFKSFVEQASIQIAKRKEYPSLEDAEGRDDYLFLSSIPWVSFTSFQHAMAYHPSDSVPRIAWGKYFEENEVVKLPISVQVHHALVDGRHVGHFFQKIQELVQFPEQLLL